MNLCCACGQQSLKQYFFVPKTTREKQQYLLEIFKKYVPVETNITDAFLCRSCHDRLLRIDNNVNGFKTQCLEYLTKRSHTPQSLYTATPVISSTENSGDEHNYYSQSVSNVNKKQKGAVPVCKELFPPISEHDHNYYDGAISDSSSFRYPDVVKSHFELNTKKDGSFFTRQETAVLQSNLSCVTKELFVEELLKISNIKEVISKKLSEICKESVNAMNNRKRGFVSVLMKKELSNLENFEWQQIVDEFSIKLPIVFNLLVNIMLPNKPTPKHMIGILPRIGMVYSILLQSRHSSLSLIQRVCSLILMDNIADQKVYDRLQTIGVCLSYQNSLLLLEELGGSFNTDVIDAVKEKKNLRIISDNVNFKTNINQQHFSHEGKTLQMHHAFASAILVNS